MNTAGTAFEVKTESLCLSKLRTKHGFDQRALDIKRDNRSIDFRNFVGTTQRLCCGDTEATGELYLLAYNNSPNSPRVLLSIINEHTKPVSWTL